MNFKRRILGDLAISLNLFKETNKLGCKPKRVPFNKNNRTSEEESPMVNKAYYQSKTSRKVDILGTLRR